MTSPALCVIPARLESTRFPNKVLQPILGEPLIWHVWRGCEESGLRTIIATDNVELVKRCRDFGAECQLTSEECGNGTERAAELLSQFDNEIFVVVQADMFGFEASLIERIAASVVGAPDRCTSAAYRTLKPKEIADPNNVKVLVDERSNAITFEREEPRGLIHVGMYGYHRSVLAAYASHGRTEAENSNSLEQLRLFEMGVPIHILETETAPASINCPEDYAQLLRRLA